MSVVAHFDVRANDFALGAVLTAEGRVDVDLESVVPLGRSLQPHLWVDLVDAERVESALSNSDLVGGAERIDEVNGLALITLDWDSPSEGFVDVVTRTCATILEGYCEDGWWTFRMRFAEFQSLSAFYNDCTEAGISLEVRRLHDLADQNPDTPYGLTEEQHRTLLVALERGYFAIPRETTLVELSEQLGISDTATSQRIRRGLASVLTSTLT